MWHNCSIKCPKSNCFTVTFETNKSYIKRAQLSSINFQKTYLLNEEYENIKKRAIQVLEIKPLIFMKADTGTVGIGLPARSRKIGLMNLYKTFFKRLDTDKPMHIAVLHNNALADAETIAAQIKEEFEPAEIFIEIVNPILGVHTGPGPVALCGYSE